MNAVHKDRLVALMARSGTPALIGALRVLDAKPELSQEERMVRAWTIDEVERRFPDAARAVEAAFEAAEEQDPPADVDYVAVLLASLPQQV